MGDFFKMLNPSYFKDTVRKCGCEITSSRFFTTVITVGCVSAGICYYLRLKWYYILLFVVITLLMTPHVMITGYKNKYQNHRFEEAISYCEQMIYSFRKKQKIRVALEDVYGTSTGYLKDIVGKMIAHIDKGDAKKNLYEETLDMLKENYDCSRVETLHTYLKEVETNGGDPSHALGILLNDIRDWSTKTLLFQKAKEDVRKKVLVAIILAMITCTMMFNCIPAEYLDEVVESVTYQICTVITLVLCELVYLFISSKIAGSLLDNEQRQKSIESAVRAIDRLANYDKKKEFKKVIVMSIIAIVTSFVLWFVLDLEMISLAPLGLIVFAIFDFMTKKATLNKMITKEINMVFPTWLRNLILHLQTDNVHVALANSLPGCPAIMKSEVRNLLVGISNSPNSIQPYVDFMKDYDLPEFKSAVRFLYSLAEFGSDDMVTQLDQLVQQNAILSAAAEDLRNQSNISLLNTLTFAPMLIGSAKLIVDLILFFTQFMSYMGNMGI